jgi:hypothetical protein
VVIYPASHLLRALWSFTLPHTCLELSLSAFVWLLLSLRAFFTRAWFASSSLYTHELPLFRLGLHQWLWMRAPEFSTEQRETLTKQLEESLVGQQMIASMEAALEQDDESKRESQSSDSSERETASKNSGRVKVSVVATLAGISYDFGQSTITKTCLGSLESNAHHFPKGYGRPPSVESIPNPRANEAVVFEDVFMAGLRMPPHLVLVDILR